MGADYRLECARGITIRGLIEESGSLLQSPGSGADQLGNGNTTCYILGLIRNLLEWTKAVRCICRYAVVCSTMSGNKFISLQMERSYRLTVAYIVIE